MAQAGLEPRPDRPEVLVVTHDRPTRAFVVRALRGSYDVVERKDSRGALKAITASDRDFRLVIVSRRTVKNRTQASAIVGLVKTLYERWPWLPVLVIGHIPDRARLTGQVLLSGARTFVQKPATAVAFRAAVTRVMGGAGPRGPTAAAVAAMNRIRTFLGEHVGETLTLGELSAMASLSRSHFSHTFHAVLGMPLRDYIRDLRLQRAHLLLLASPLSLTAIAAESGFYDLPHFDKAFPSPARDLSARVSPPLFHAAPAEGSAPGSRRGRRSPPMLRQSGIDVVGALPWGTHFCHLYETRADLVDTVVPFLKGPGWTTGSSASGCCRSR